MVGVVVVELLARGHQCAQADRENEGHDNIRHDSRVRGRIESKARTELCLGVNIVAAYHRLGRKLSTTGIVVVAFAGAVITALLAWSCFNSRAEFWSIAAYLVSQSPLFFY